MSLEQAAKHLAAHGRGPDTQLIHMSKNEVNSLQALAKANGGSLTVNPHTGLPEAGFLDKLLPAIIGGAAMYFTGGTAAPLIAGMSNAATIGLGVGALQTARTGSLQKGLMAGLGAYGGAGLAGGLMNAGAQQVGQTALNQSAAESARLGMSQAPFDAAAKEVVANTSNADLMSKGVSSLGQPGGFTNLSNTMAASGGPSLGRAGLAAAAPVLASAMQPKTEQPKVESDAVMPQRLKYNVGRPLDAQGQAITPAPDVPSYESGMTRNFGREQNYFPSAGYTNISQEEAKGLRGYADGGDIQGDPNMQSIRTYDPVVRMAHGGLSAAASHLGDYSDGGRLLKGPGDGVSDSIPAVIGNKRPARLADGEFVVPARIVSELGNGSTDAGARKLYAMLDRVQAARKKSIGKGKVAKNSRADKLLPA